MQETKALCKLISKKVILIKKVNYDKDELHEVEKLLNEALALF